MKENTIDFVFAERLDYIDDTLECSWIKCIPAVTETVFEYEYVLYNWYYDYDVETRWDTEAPISDCRSQFVWKATGNVRTAGVKIIKKAEVVRLSVLSYAAADLNEYDF